MLTASIDPDGAAFRQRRKSVLDRVFHQRHQHHRRNRNRLQRFGSVDLEREARAHPDLLHIQIRNGERKLSSERRLGFAHLRQRRAQIASQMLQHRSTRLGLRLIEPPHIGQRVE